MIQSLDVPVVSLSVPNIHKLDAITSDDLSCMWTVFTKCKDNLENGRRLENMSWRLWYRETLIEKAQEQHVRTPIPIQQSTAAAPTKPSEEEEDYFNYASSASSASTCSTVQTPPSLKHVSPSSFKRMISSLNTPIAPCTLIPLVPHPTITAAAAAEHPCPAVQVLSTTTAAPPPITVEVIDDLPEKMEITAPEPPANKSTMIMLTPKPITARSSKFFVSDDEDDSDNDDSLTNACDNDDGFWSTVRSEDNCVAQIRSQPARRNNNNNNDGNSTTRGDFTKRILNPAPLPSRRSLLTSMLNANPTNPMARPRRIGHRKRHSNDAELSQSLQYCVNWEQQQNAFFDEFMAPPMKVHESPMTNNHWDGFHGW